MHELLPALEERFGNKEAVYRRLARQTGIKPGSVRRYFQKGGQLKCAPLAVYRVAAELADGNGCSARTSYLADRRTRRLASRTARQMNELLRQWRKTGRPEFETAYRRLRHSLIALIKEHGARQPRRVEIGPGAQVPSRQPAR